MMTTHPHVGFGRRIAALERAHDGEEAMGAHPTIGQQLADIRHQLTEIMRRQERVEALLLELLEVLVGTAGAGGHG